MAKANQDEPTVVGRYVLDGEVASGGMATVYHGRRLDEDPPGTTVAVKRVHPHLAKDKRFASMFIDEARLVSRIHHPNVIRTVEATIAEGAAAMAEELGLRFIITGTTTGNTARHISSFRPHGRIIAMTPIPSVARRMALIWGVDAFVIDAYKYFETLIDIIEARMLRENLAGPGEIIAITSGMPVGEGGTNVVKIHKLP